MPETKNNTEDMHMADETEIRTATMAKIYAAQGHYDKAAMIYRDLLEKDPGRHDLAQALAEVENKRIDKSNDKRKDLAALFGKWIKLLLRYKQIRHLERIRHSLGDVKSTKLKSD